MKYDCGCINELHSSGLTRNVHKCDFHVQWSKEHPQGNSEFYFKDIGALDSVGIPQFQNHIKEFHNAFDELGIDLSGRGRALLEVGFGLGQYIPLFLAHDWVYAGIECADYAYSWASAVYGPAVTLIQQKFEHFHDNTLYHTIFGSHAFEHMVDAPAMLKKAHSLLTSHGQLWLILPDDGDPTNPDHLWFFNEDTLKGFLKSIGFVNVRSTMRKIVAQENFIYCAAEKG